MSHKFANIHILVSHSPSCLNRDDMNMQKEAVFGGVKRARISSQCSKRADRFSEQYAALFGNDNRSTRTTLDTAGQLLKALQDSGSKADPAACEYIVKTLGMPKDKVVTPWINEEICYLANALCKVLQENKQQTSVLEQLSAANDEEGSEDDEEKSGKKGKGPKLSKELSDLKKKIVKAIKDADEGFLKSGISSVDIALSGRMCAAKEQVLNNVEGAMSIAHAITTHAMNSEIDWFTAMNDLSADADELGAGHLNTQEFGAGVFYQYASIDIDLLAKNMGRGRKEALDVVSKWVYVMSTVTPTGKQRSFASHSLAHYVMVTLSDLPLSMANAFEKPVEKSREGGYMKPSVKALEDFWTKNHKAYGIGEDAAVFSIDKIELAEPSVKKFDAIKDLQAWIKEEE